VSEAPRDAGPATPGDSTPAGSQTSGADAGDASLARRVLDLFVYAPTGALMTVLEELPDLATKGRTRIEGQVRNAHVMGQFAVAKARRDLKKRFAPSSPAPDTTHPAPDQSSGGPRAPWPADTAGPEAKNGSGTVHGGSFSGSPTQGAGPRFSRQEAPDSVDTAISGYDTLSASQVVRRLDGLDPVALQAVYHHEAATRGRRTILHRVQQLLGAEGVPGASAPSD
jgi:hypothetical protein